MSKLKVEMWKCDKKDRVHLLVTFTWFEEAEPSSFWSRQRMNELSPQVSLWGRSKDKIINNGPAPVTASPQLSPNTVSRIRMAARGKSVQHHISPETKHLSSITDVHRRRNGGQDLQDHLDLEISRVCRISKSSCYCMMLANSVATDWLLRVPHMLVQNPESFWAHVCKPKAGVQGRDREVHTVITETIRMTVHQQRFMSTDKN